MKKRVAVVGAGPGGLAAAMLLSHAGADVTVFEERDCVGGRTSTIGNDSYRFDLGPTFFLYPQILREIFVQCGLDLDAAVAMKRLDPHYHLHFERGGTLLARPDPADMERQIAALSSVDAGGFARFLEHNRRKFTAFAPILQRPFGSFTEAIKPDLLPVLPYFKPWRSVESDLRMFFGDERLRLACAFQSKYLGMSPFTCPSIFTILSFLEYEYGVFHPIGGCAAVSRAMAKAAEGLGASVRLSEPVTRISFEGRTARKVHTPAGTYDCDALVINADFAHAMEKLVPDELRRKWSNAQLERKKYSCSTFMLYLGINRELPELKHHNIFISADYHDNLTDIEQRHVLSPNPSFYVCNPSLTDPTLAPPGNSALYVLVPVSHLHPGIDWKQEAQRFRRLTFDQLAKIGIKDLEKDIEYERMITPDDWQESFSVYRGAVFNLAHSLDQMLFRRPANRFGELDGVYLVGGGTHPGSGLPVIYESARITARLVAKDMGL
jgi:phytoene desaturase